MGYDIKLHSNKLIITDFLLTLHLSVFTFEEVLEFQFCSNLQGHIRDVDNEVDFDGSLSPANVKNCESRIQNINIKPRSHLATF